jgi:hypothetical protein
VRGDGHVEPRLVLCAGIPRSGSTWLYNAARLACAAEPGGAHAAWVDDYDASAPDAWHVVKLHDPHATLETRATVVLTSRRDLRDIAASARRRAWFDDEAQILAFLDRVVAQHAHWAPRAALDLDYRWIERDAPRAAAAVLAALGLVGVDAVDERATRLAARIEAANAPERGAAGYDPVTLLHPEHRLSGRSGAYAEVLPPSLVSAIEERFGAWLSRHGEDAPGAETAESPAHG